MFSRSLAMAAVAVLVSVGPAAAQKVEVSGLVGWTLSDGVEGDAGPRRRRQPVRPGRPEGFGVVGPRGRLQRHRQHRSRVPVRPAAELAEDQRHGHARPRRFDDQHLSPLRRLQCRSPGRARAPVPADRLRRDQLRQRRVHPRQRRDAETGSETQFSTTWGLGVKVFGGSNVGFRAGMQWTPTYIKSDSGAGGAIPTGAATCGRCQVC